MRADALLEAEPLFELLVAHDEVAEAEEEEELKGDVIVDDADLVEDDDC